MVEDEKEGWKLTYRRVTPRWASYSGIRNEQIRYVRAIAVCNDRAALFVINYSSDEKIPYGAIPEGGRLLRTVKQSIHPKPVMAFRRCFED